MNPSQKLFIFTVLSAIAALPSAQADESSFARCVRILHKQGGMKLSHELDRTKKSQDYHDDARSRCLSSPSESVLTCQNRLYLFGGWNPVKALDDCEHGADDSRYANLPMPHGKFDPIQKVAETKKTVCSITVNSDNEREAFRKFLPNFRHVELLGQPEDEDACVYRTKLEGYSPEDARNQCAARMKSEAQCQIREKRKNPSLRHWDALQMCSEHFRVRDDFWLDRACGNEDLRCDVVVVSGHFAGTFLGSSGYDIGLSSLADRSSAKTCTGLFQSAKDVFLFGCNTLGQHGDDRGRSTSDYREVLVSDGLDPADAQRVSAQRHTDFGPTFRQQMQKLFPNAHHIVGYSAGAPTGDNVSGTLSSFLRTVSSSYASGLENNSSHIGSALAASFGGNASIEKGVNLLPSSAPGKNPSPLVPESPTAARKKVSAFVAAHSKDLPDAAWTLVARSEEAGKLETAEANRFRRAIVSSGATKRTLCAVTLDFGSTALKGFGNPYDCSTPEWMIPNPKFKGEN